MKQVKACIHCGSMLEGDLEHERAVCDRCHAQVSDKPKPQAESASRAPVPPEQSETKGPAKRILIIDDEPVLVKLLSSRLRNAGYDTLIASDGEEGYRQIKREKPDLVLSDILMPKLTGYELLQKIRKETDGTEHTPILIMTAKGSMRNYFSDWEIEGFITKPIDPEHLLGQIKELIHSAEILKKTKNKKRK